MKELEFDVVIHLIGRQTVPNYMAIRLTDAPRHVLITTAETIDRANMLRAVCEPEGKTIDALSVPAMDYASVKAIVDDWLAGNPGVRIGVNITGGTKPMSTAVLDICRERGLTPFYLDTDNRKIYFFAPPYGVVEMPPVFGSVLDFARIAGYTVSNEGIRATDLPLPRRGLLRAMWDCRKHISHATQIFARATDQRKWKSGESMRTLYAEGVDQLERVAQSSQSRASLISAWEANFPTFSEDAVRFGAGIWFEQWLLCQLADSKNASGHIDLRSGISLKLREESEKDAQEIDLAFTDGYNLWVFECKSGGVEQAHIQKLENISRSLGGVMGRGVLCSVHKPENEIVLQRIEFGNLSLVTEDALPVLAKSTDKIRSRHNYVKPTDFK